MYQVSPSRYCGDLLFHYEILCIRGSRKCYNVGSTNIDDRLVLLHQSKQNTSKILKRIFRYNASIKCNKLTYQFYVLSQQRRLDK